MPRAAHDRAHARGFSASLLLAGTFGLGDSRGQFNGSVEHLVASALIVVFAGRPRSLIRNRPPT
jgi:hypothetical protein